MPFSRSPTNNIQIFCLLGEGNIGFLQAHDLHLASAAAILVILPVQAVVSVYYVIFSRSPKNDNEMFAGGYWLLS